MIKIIFIFFIFLFINFSAKETFTQNHIFKYLNRENPFISTLFNKEYVAQQKIDFHKSPFDVNFGGKYDYKDYPISSADYSEIFAKKKFQSGIELQTGYRKAYGTQEYNNIKTGDNGELLTGIKMPLTNLFTGANQYQTDLDIAILDGVKQKYNSQNSFRLLYFEVLKAYYNLIYNKLILELEHKLLKKATDRQNFIKQKVTAGILPELSNIEAKQLIINRKQRMLTAKTNYENSLSYFVQFLNTSSEHFKSQYILQNSLDFNLEDFNFDELMQIAIKNRPDLKMLNYDKQKLYVEKKNINSLKYPELNVGLYGVHDFKYGSGFKISLGMNFPIQRSKYKSKLGEYAQNLQNIEQLENKKIIEIKTILRNIISSLEILSTNITNALQEIQLVQKLEKAENKKYLLGNSNLFLLNQREIYTLDTEKKVLKYKLNYLLLKEELKIETAEKYFNIL
jgi:outer membrane protein TolC